MAASFFTTGQIVVVNAGVPVQFPVPLTVSGPMGPQGLSTVHAILIEVLETNLGKVYIGLAGMNKISRVGVLLTLPIPTANLIPTFSISLTAAANALSLSDLWLDADNSGEGVTVGGVVA